MPSTNNQEAQVLSDEEWQRVWDARDVDPPNGQVSQQFARRLYETIAAQAKTIAGLRDALGLIERGKPAGGNASAIGANGAWREYARALQQVARNALGRAPTPPAAGGA